MVALRNYGPQFGTTTKKREADVIRMEARMQRRTYNNTIFKSARTKISVFSIASQVAEVAVLIADACCIHLNLDNGRRLRMNAFLKLMQQYFLLNETESATKLKRNSILRTFFFYIIALCNVYKLAVLFSVIWEQCSNFVNPTALCQQFVQHSRRSWNCQLGQKLTVSVWIAANCETFQHLFLIFFKCSAMVCSHSERVIGNIPFIQSEY